MSHRKLLLTSTLLISLLVGALVGCQPKDEFAGAPTVAAPTASAQAPAGQGAAAAPAAPAAGPLGAGVDTKSLPADHPPIGAPGVTDGLPPAPAAPAGALRWEAPAGWQSAKPASSMRMAEYVVPGDAGAASMTVFYFGAGGGGGVEANIERWIGQFKGQGGAQPQAKRETLTVGGLTVHTVDVSGTFNAGSAMTGGAQDLAEQRVLGAIVETPQGPYFFKLLGPAATIAAQQASFNAFVQSFKL